MSLVAYASSDSDNDQDDENHQLSNNKNILISVSTKKREPVKITIPSLDQFKEDDPVSDSVKKPAIKSGSGLFSMLPPPKYSAASDKKSFVPHILTKKPQVKSNPVTPKPLMKSSINEQTDGIPLLEPDVKEDSDLEDNEEPTISSKVNSTTVDYFSLDQPSSTFNRSSEVNNELVSDSDLFRTLPQPVPSHTVATESKPSVQFASSEVDVSQDIASHEGQYIEEETANFNFAPQQPNAYPEELVSAGSSSQYHTSDEIDLTKDERFQRLTGRRERESIQFVEVSGADQLSGKDEWLIQNLTEERQERPSKRRHDMPTQQQKRKHQITYLAYQAKERELDLKNQWALNSRTRRETQAKYGF